MELPFMKFHDPNYGRPIIVSAGAKTAFGSHPYRVFSIGY